MTDEKKTAEKTTRKTTRKTTKAKQEASADTRREAGSNVVKLGNGRTRVSYATGITVEK